MATRIPTIYVMAASMLAGCTSENVAPRGPYVEGVYAVTTRAVSTTCEPPATEPRTEPTHVELVYEGHQILLYPCDRVSTTTCFAFADDKYAVGDLQQVIEDGYEGEAWTYNSGTASCFAGFVRSRLVAMEDAVRIEDTRRGGIVPDLAPEACAPVNLPPPDELPCLWYEELTLSPYP